MTDIHHSTDFWPATDQVRCGTDWGTVVIAVLALTFVLGLPHLMSNTASDVSWFQDSENSTIQLDGRGKWVGYM